MAGDYGPYSTKIELKTTWLDRLLFKFGYFNKGWKLLNSHSTLTGKDAKRALMRREANEAHEDLIECNKENEHVA